MNSVEDSAFPMVSSSSSASHEYEGSASLSLPVVEVVKELGLITCGRSEFCHGGKTPRLAGGAG